MFELRSPILPEPLRIRPGEMVQLVGPNGCGKTSLLRALAGLVPYVPATARWGNEDPADVPARDLAFRVCYVPEVARDAFVGLTAGGEARMRGMPREDPRETGTLSSGEARRLALSFLHGDLWLLDEPTEGLDAAGLAELRARLQGRGDAAVVFVDHNGGLAGLADRTVTIGPAAGGARWHEAATGDPIAWTVTQALHGIELPALEVRRGIQLATGPNGCGKTTLLRAAAGLDGQPLRLDGGAARIGKDVRLLLPDARAHLHGASVGEDLERSAPDIVAAMVPRHLLDRHPLTLSRGEAQRVALAKVLGVPAPVYLLDEPEAHLDAGGREALAALLRLRQESAVVIATHDAELRQAYEAIWEGT